ncbi:MAG: hypothetical protein ACO26K_04455 [Candidatus Limnocylindrus sp.]|jgi:hypothetical protein
MNKVQMAVASAALGALMVVGVSPAAAAGHYKTALEAIGITRLELKDARSRGITLAALASEQGISEAALIAALVAPRYAAIEAAADAATAAGTPWKVNAVANKKAKVLAKVTAHINVALQPKVTTP